MIRLDKFLADMGLGTRSEVKKILKSKKVSVNGLVITKPEYKVDEEKDQITFAGKALVYEAFSYYLFHKPAGCVTATKDREYKTVMDYLPEELKKDFSPVGRLDLDTEGLLLITNDGELTHHLISPSHHVPKTYFARVDAPLREEMISIFQKGIPMDGEITLPADLVIKSEFEAELTIYEGKYHQVKRMFEHVGCKVTYLKRLSMGPLVLGDLPKASYRKLTEAELLLLKKES